jgi:hypothetical protein
MIVEPSTASVLVLLVWPILKFEPDVNYARTRNNLGRQVKRGPVAPTAQQGNAVGLSELSRHVANEARDFRVPAIQARFKCIGIAMGQESGANFLVTRCSCCRASSAGQRSA